MQVHDRLSRRGTRIESYVVAVRSKLLIESGPHLIDEIQDRELLGATGVEPCRDEPLRDEERVPWCDRISVSQRERQVVLSDPFGPWNVEKRKPLRHACSECSHKHRARNTVATARQSTPSNRLTLRCGHGSVPRNACPRCPRACFIANVSDGIGSISAMSATARRWPFLVIRWVAAAYGTAEIAIVREASGERAWTRRQRGAPRSGCACASSSPRTTACTSSRTATGRRASRRRMAGCGSIA